MRATARTGCSSPSAAASSASCQPGASTATVFLDLRSKSIAAANEQGLLGLAFHRVREQRSLVRLLHARRRRRAGHRRVPTIAQTRTSRDPDGSVVLVIPHPRAVEPQRRHARVRTGRLPLPRHRRRRVGERPAEQCAEHRRRCSARSCASTSTAGSGARQPLQRSRRQSVRQCAGPGRDLRDRAAQSLALQLRSRARARCGSATSARTRARRSTRRSSAAATTAGASTRERRARTTTRRCATRRTSSPRFSSTRTRRALLGHRRLRVSRTRGTLAAGHLCLR